MQRLTAAAVVLSAAAATPSLAHTAEGHGVKPWSEAVVSVADLEASAEWLIEDGGWQEVSAGAVSPEEIAYWRLPAAASGEYRKVCAAEATTGCIRLISRSCLLPKTLARA